VQHATIPTRLLYSNRTPQDVIYHAELDALAQSDGGLEVAFTYTRESPEGWNGYRRRIDPAMLAEVMQPLGTGVRAYVCGPTLLVETVADALLALGLPPERIYTERFGPTGA